MGRLSSPKAVFAFTDTIEKFSEVYVTWLWCDFIAVGHSTSLKSFAILLLRVLHRLLTDELVIRSWFSALLFLSIQFFLVGPPVLSSLPQVLTAGSLLRRSDTGQAFVNQRTSDETSWQRLKHENHWTRSFLDSTCLALFGCRALWCLMVASRLWPWQNNHEESLSQILDLTVQIFRYGGTKSWHVWA